MTNCPLAGDPLHYNRTQQTTSQYTIAFLFCEPSFQLSGFYGMYFEPTEHE